ncbi:MAG: Hsp33 family molecular chaperone HslO [Candidatus Vecturithrix sp.]|jgi:molecular chaperone Hsp33|nr:Hsp33 family molecular chaperone HslO [Candidatus Vecturithrix sp.]
MNDYLIRSLSTAGNIRALACVTTDLVSEACQRHGASITASVAFGRVLTGSALMGALLKPGQRVAVKFEGNGPLRKIIAEAESNGIVRGYVGVPGVDLPLKRGKIDVAGAIGHAGFLTVSKDLRLKEPYKGMVQLYTSEVAEDLAYYFTESEQIPSAVGLGVYIEPDARVSAAGGFLIQALPPAEKHGEALDALVNRIHAMPPVTELLRESATPETLLARVFADIPYEVLETHPLNFQCSCSKPRMEQALIALGHQDLVALLQEREEVEVTCEFCRERYLFDRAELEHLVRGIQ